MVNIPRHICTMNMNNGLFILCFFQITSGNFKDKSINSVSDELLEAGKLLEKVTPRRRSCLTTFTNCFELVIWLRESIKGKELYCKTKEKRNIALYTYHLQYISFYWCLQISQIG